MSFNVINYEVDTGRITGVATHDLSKPLGSNQLLHNDVALGVAKDNYVVSGGLVTRPTMPIEHNTTTGMFTGVPVDAIVYIQEQRYVVTDGEFSVDFPFSGTYSVYISKFPYQDYFGVIVI